MREDKIIHLPDNQACACAPTQACMRKDQVTHTIYDRECACMTMHAHEPGHPSTSLPG